MYFPISHRRPSVGGAWCVFAFCTASRSVSMVPTAIAVCGITKAYPKADGQSNVILVSQCPDLSLRAHQLSKVGPEMASPFYCKHFRQELMAASMLQESLKLAKNAGMIFALEQSPFKGRKHERTTHSIQK